MRMYLYRNRSKQPISQNVLYFSPNLVYKLNQSEENITINRCHACHTRSWFVLR